MSFIKELQKITSLRSAYLFAFHENTIFTSDSDTQVFSLYRHPKT